MRQFKHANGYIDFCREDWDESILYIDFLEATIKGSGYGRSLLADFLEYAKGLPGIKSITLSACGNYGVPIEKLEGFYSGFGFSVQDRNKWGTMMELIL